MPNSPADQQGLTHVFQNRQQKLSGILRDININGMALNPGPSLTYLTGLHFHLSERPVVGLFSPEKPPVIVLPELESGKLKNLDYPCLSFPYGEDPAAWSAAFTSGLEEAGLTNHTIGLETRRMRLLEYYLLESSAPQASFKPADEAIAEMRMKKDSAEASLMRNAVKIAQKALQNVLQGFKMGMSEREFASELTMQLLRLGSDPEFPFSPIVSGGPNSANPHAVPSDRPIQLGDLLVVDWGAASQGYISDITRTFAIGPVEDEFTKIAELVLQANTAGRRACRPGVSAGSVDLAARRLIDQAGYGKYFFHRTGHGIGMESHEDPYIRSGNPLLFQPGMCFTVEPGIYLTGRGGVRIEDNVMITGDGVECFMDMPRELKSLIA